MSLSNLKIVITHPGKQHTHQLCYAVQKKGYFSKFITTFWYKPENKTQSVLLKMAGFFAPGFNESLKKRYFKPLDEKKIELFPLYDIFRILVSRFLSDIEKINYYGYRVIDWYSAFRLKQLDFDIHIGYENSCLRSFRQAKKKGKITILDLAQVHHNEIINLRNKYPYFKSVLMNTKFFNYNNKHKQAQFQYTDYFFVLSEYAKDTLIAAGIPEYKIYKTYLGFDPKKFEPKNHYPVSGTFKILFTGIITNRKGIALVLEAFKQLNLENAQLTFIGPMADGEAVLKEYEGLYTYIPFMYQDELVKQYQQADIFVFPSYLDSWAMVVTEAMACGTPVIVSENTGSKDAVAEGGGFVIPVDDVNALKEKILYFYNNRNEIEKIGKIASKSIQKYTWDNYHKQITDTIEAIAARENIRIPN